MPFDIASAAKRLKEVCAVTPLDLHTALSEQYQCNLYLKREDKQVVRSYKIRGAYNKISSLRNTDLSRGVVCASAGNHAQGVAYSCRLLNVHGTIFIPANTPQQKIERVKKWSGDHIQLFLEGDTYDDCYYAAKEHQLKTGQTFIHPFDDEKIIEGQGTVGLEITDVLENIDYVLVPVGGGGLAAGIGTWFKQYSPNTILIGVEPEGAASMTAAFEAGKPVELERIDPFVDGAAVRKVGELNYHICKETVQHIHTVAEGKVCSTLLQLYNDEAMVLEPAGALTIAALDDFAEMIKGKTVVCIVSGSNNDVLRMEEIKKLADAYEGLHHHLIIRFKHQPDELNSLFTKILGLENYITGLHYDRREHGRSTYGWVCIKSASKDGYKELLKRMNTSKMEYTEVTKDDFLFKYLI
ncbi:MAG: threonine ammonia-lyase [Bacteroidota bacterium]